MSSPGLRTIRTRTVDEIPEPEFLVHWENPLLTFSSNLEYLLHDRFVLQESFPCAPDYEFWQDIDIRRPVPARGLMQSVVLHAGLLACLYLVSTLPSTTLHLASPYAHTVLHDYSIGEYLPEVKSEMPKARAAAKHDPAYAAQEILSIPSDADNNRQTLVTPPQVHLRDEVKLPNIVAWEPVAPVQPLSATERSTASLQLPQFTPDVIHPTADTSALRSRNVPNLQPSIVEPTADVSQLQSKLTVPAFHPQVVEPTADVSRVHSATKLGALATATPHVAEPVPEPPSMRGVQSKASGQIIALSLNPSEVKGPVEVPAGNRRGTFAASPTGKPNASGTPGAVASTGPDKGVSGSGTGAGNGNGSAPAGISVGAAPAGAKPATVAAAPAPKPSVAANIPPQPIAKESLEPRNAIETRVFSGKRSYTMAVNMPSFTSATGSWIIHFAERQQSKTAEPIAAPEVVKKTDPAYPPTLVNDGVQGTVVLSAVIHADGSVGDIVVEQSLERQLDQNAVRALQNWKFRPALKNGEPIELQAVIRVPFHSPRTSRF